MKQYSSDPIKPAILTVQIPIQTLNFLKFAP